MQCLNFFPTCEFEWIDPKEFELNKYTGNSSKGCAIEVDLEYPKELRELHSHYPLALDKNKEKRRLSINYRLLIYRIFLLAMLKTCA